MIFPRKSQRGSSVVIFGISIFVIMGFSALVTDVGMMAYHRARLSNAVDSAALAGAQELIYQTGSASMKASDYLRKNGYQSASYSITTEDGGSAIRVSASYTVDFLFAKALGFHSRPVHVTAKGKVLPVIAVNNGIRPFAIEDQALQYGTSYLLKEGGGDGTTGNYGAISLGGTGSKVYYSNVVNGYSGRLMVGDYIDTEPGNMSGPTESGIETLLSQCPHTPKCAFDQFVPGCPKIVTIVIVDSLNVNGRSTVQIKGFASFFLEGVGGSGNDSEVKGRFIRTVTSGEMAESQTDYGLYGVKLMP